MPKRLNDDLNDRDAVWPRAVLDAAATMPDFPVAEELTEGYGPDAPREPME
jgi:hypothetical protein